jgi:hypothetical protein
MDCFSDFSSLFFRRHPANEVCRFSYAAAFGGAPREREIRFRMEAVSRSRFQSFPQVASDSFSQRLRFV